MAYEKDVDGRSQIVYHDIGKPARVISGPTEPGNGDSRNPVVGNSGFYVTFETDATNLGGSRGRDANGRPDVYLYTDVRMLGTSQSVDGFEDMLPGGGTRPGMSWYANYIVFESPAPLGGDGPAADLRALAGRDLAWTQSCSVPARATSGATTRRAASG